ncbi:hypothetical protein QJU93_10050 [Pasteurella skyensis]|uniref:Uncharacterized protein n=1 Tax=Phocoenobacter skyensis TaxID=97481 RepID=A0AAJ6NBG4_9PAST|nr:hypothetical protein [Pasteurella skyensis]MDP8173697.1 hypothetical protein [Pasteurella skyensis]MDP8178065.1 hypothetical protein [Pasteurella skyensis]
MTILTKTQTVAKLRAYAKENGMTFKKENHTISNQEVYKFINRKTKETVITNLTLEEAYENMNNGQVCKLAVENNCIENTRDTLINELIEELEDFKSSENRWVATKHQEFKNQIEYVHVDGHAEEISQEAIDFFNKEKEQNKANLESLKNEYLEKNTKNYLIDEITKLTEAVEKEINCYISNVIDFYLNELKSL